jgi:hypothetical protein
VYIKNEEVRTIQFIDMLLMRPLHSEYSTPRPCLSKNVNSGMYKMLNSMGMEL